MTAIASHLHLTTGSRAIDEVCERFEAAWRSGAKVRIEELLEQTPWPPAAELIRELILVEVELRRELGSTPSIGEYMRRFPQWIHLLRGMPIAAEESAPVLNGDEGTGEIPGDFEPPGYRIIEEIGRGGMGIVFKAIDRRLNRLVALKVIRRGGSSSAFDGRHLRREAKTIAQLRHPGIVQVFTVDEHRGHTYLVLELIEGHALKDLADESPKDTHWSAWLVARLARVIEYAHRRGVIHRDLKPANILLKSYGEIGSHRSTTGNIDDEGPIPVVTDFGLAKRISSGETISGKGALFGTPGYMPPEQADGRSFHATPASDVYSLGAILYELLTGRPPFVADSQLATIQMVCRDEAIPVVQRRPHIAAELDRICLRCLAKNPQRRYPTAEALANDLQVYLRGRPAVGCESRSLTTVRSYSRTTIASGAGVIRGLVGFAMSGMRTD